MRKERHQEEFLAHVNEKLKGSRPVNVKDAVRAVFKVLATHITRGQADKVASSLPGEIRVLWPSAEQGTEPLAEVESTAAVKA